MKIKVTKTEWQHIRISKCMEKVRKTLAGKSLRSFVRLTSCNKALPMHHDSPSSFYFLFYFFKFFFGPFQHDSLSLWLFPTSLFATKVAEDFHGSSCLITGSHKKTTTCSHFSLFLLCQYKETAWILQMNNDSYTLFAKHFSHLWNLW